MAEGTRLQELRRELTSPVEEVEQCQENGLNKSIDELKSLIGGLEYRRNLDNPIKEMLETKETLISLMAHPTNLSSRNLTVKIFEDGL
ncbi:unnamed protein product [Dovyalis caffra]|uniref:Uncharacterized protein n=1 Tax=Dovyalis caffra TaxID=77055 RepID=A0AAV1QPQ9_9ROSI|nr:unnamed protein product [Dovyalis caffra]